MSQHTHLAADNDTLNEQVLDYIDRMIIPDRFRYCCERWFDDHKGRYETIYGDVGN